MCEIAAKIRKKYVIGQYSYYSLAYSNLIYFTISWSTKLNYIILRTERALTERAPTGQQAHSPGQSAAAPRAMCLLPRWGAFCQGTFCPEDDIV